MSPLILCPACDLVHRNSVLSARGRTRCSRCGAPLQRGAGSAVDTALALAVCTLVLLVMSNAYPLVEMQVNGNSRETTLIGAALGLHAQHFDSLALLVFLTTVVAPLLQIAALLYLLIPVRQGLRAPGQEAVFRILVRVRPWTFMEVFMLGALAALVRLSNFAHIVSGVSLWACVLLMFSLSALTSVTSPEQIWRWIERSRE
jgi:paraquat-inducible protein A